MTRFSTRCKATFLGLIFALLVSGSIGYWFIDSSQTQAQETANTAVDKADSYEDLVREVRRLTAEVERLSQRVAAMRPANAGSAKVASTQALLPDHPEPWLSADEMLRRKVQGIGKEIERLRRGGETDEADRLALRLDDLQKRLQTGKFPAPTKRHRELHVVGLYEGGSRRLQIGSAEVHVTWQGAPVVLCLCAYSQVEWTVTVAEGVQLEQIILGGYHPQTVGKAPSGASVVNRSGRETSGGALRSVYNRTSDDSSEGGYPEFARDLKTMTGLDINTFQGAYRYEGRPIIVGPESAPWRVDRVLPEVDALHEIATRAERARRLAELRHLRFHAMHAVGDARSYGEFTVLGPISSTLRPVNNHAHQLVVDPRGPTYFGRGGHEVLLVDLEQQTVEAMRTPNNIPEMSWLSAIAFDSKRNRLLATTFAGGGYLYSYSPTERTWSVLAQPGLASSALVYVASEDTLFGLDNAMDQLREFYRFSPQGAQLEKIKLSEPITRDGITPQLAWAEGRLMLVLVGTSHHHSRRIGSKPRGYTIDPRTGEVLFACYLEAQADSH